MKERDLRRVPVAILLALSALPVFALACAAPAEALASPQAASGGEEAQQTTSEQAGNVRFVRPAGWKRQDNPDGTVALIPPDLLPDQQVGLLILQGGDIGGADLRTWFDGAWQALLQANQARVVSGGEAQARRGDGFDIASTSAVVESAGARRTYLTFFVAGPGTRSEAVLFTADREDLYKRYVGAVNTLLETLGFANLQSGGQPATTSSPAAPVAVGRGQGQLQVESIYMGFATDYVGLSPTLATERQHRFNFLVFYTNGLVYRGGAANFMLGPARLDLANEAVRQFSLGTYRVSGDLIEIAWSGAYAGKTDVIQRQGDRLSIRGTAGTPWQRLPTVDGLRLQGTYIPATQTVEPKGITFGADGTFREQGVVAHVHTLYFLERGLTAPPGGTGTYAIQDHTLTLHYSDGLVMNTLLFVLPGDDFRRPRQIMLTTYFYELQG